MQNKSVNEFLVKLLIFISPFLFAVLIELFVLPLDFFTHRAWEALLVMRYEDFLPGPFYPDQTLSTFERGDLGDFSKVPSHRKAFWETDSYGFRKKGNGTPHPDIVIIGDSNVAGSGLSQEETLSEVLQAKLHALVYPYSPANMNRFLNDTTFQNHLPKVVIVVSMERFIPELPIPEIWNGFKIQMKRKYLEKMWRQKFYVDLFIFLDRLYKQNMYHYIKARIFPKTRGITYGGGVYFFHGERETKDIPNQKFEGIVQTIEAEKQVMERRGIRFIFLPIPNKENILHEYLPSKKKRGFLKDLIRELKKKGIEVVDTQTLFDQAYGRGVSLYNDNETHWNAVAVQKVANLLAVELNAIDYS